MYDRAREQVNAMLMMGLCVCLVVGQYLAAEQQKSSYCEMRSVGHRVRPCA